jgi:hypothetical protein
MLSNRCPNCGVMAPVVEVHGHMQCANCKMNISPCCEGAAQCDVELSWHPVGSPLPAGHVVAQDLGAFMHHNHYAVLIRKAG